MMTFYVKWIAYKILWGHELPHSISIVTIACLLEG